MGNAACGPFRAARQTTATVPENPPPIPPRGGVGRPCVRLPFAVRCGCSLQPRSVQRRRVRKLCLRNERRGDVGRRHLLHAAHRQDRHRHLRPPGSRRHRDSGHRVRGRAGSLRRLARAAVGPPLRACDPDRGPKPRAGPRLPCRGARADGQRDHRSGRRPSCLGGPETVRSAGVGTDGAALGGVAHGRRRLLRRLRCHRRQAARCAAAAGSDPAGNRARAARAQSHRHRAHPSRDGRSPGCGGAGRRRPGRSFAERPSTPSGTTCCTPAPSRACRMCGRRSPTPPGGTGPPSCGASPRRRSRRRRPPGGSCADAAQARSTGA